MSDPFKDARTIRASEVGQYIYCNRQWWLQRVEGIRPNGVAMKRMEMGSEYHREHVQLVQRAARNEKLIFVLIVAAVSIVVLALLLTLAPA